MPRCAPPPLRRFCAVPARPCESTRVTIKFFANVLLWGIFMRPTQRKREERVFRVLVVLETQHSRFLRVKNATNAFIVCEMQQTRFQRNNRVGIALNAL